MVKSYGSTPPTKLPAIFNNTITVPTKVYVNHPTKMEVNFYKEMIGQLIQARKNKSISQESLNAMLGVTDGQINKWECGARLPSSFNLMCWCNALGLKINLESINE
jgi:ribosome-binding protein aMBF1 (putative translation factor)